MAYTQKEQRALTKTIPLPVLVLARAPTKRDGLEKYNREPWTLCVLFRSAV